MDKLTFSNTYKKGRVTYVVFQEDKRYTAVCLEFDLVVNESTFKEAKESIQDYAHLWLENVAKNHLSETMLNRPAEKKYWRIYQRILEAEKQKIEAELTQKSQPKITVANSLTASFQLPYSGNHQNFAFP
jgi:hypothetical protein